MWSPLDALVVRPVPGEGEEALVAEEGGDVGVEGHSLVSSSASFFFFFFCRRRSLLAAVCCLQPRGEEEGVLPAGVATLAEWPARAPQKERLEDATNTPHKVHTKLHRIK